MHDSDCLSHMGRDCDCTSEPPRDPYNDGYTHEAMHAAHIACDMWDSHVVETRCAEEYPDVRAAIEKASDAMYFVYQLIGQKFNDDDAVEQNTPGGK